MRRRLLLVAFLIIAVFLAISAWQLPALLKAIPSRYVARLPEPIQALGVRDHVEMLPTAPAAGSSGQSLDVNELLAADLAPDQADSLVTGTAQAVEQRLPATPTPPATTGPPSTKQGETQTPEPSPTVTASPSPTATPVALPAAHQLLGVEHRIQTWNNCGPATLSMALSYFDVYHTQTQIADTIKPDPEDRNVSPQELASYVEETTDLAAISRTNGDLQTLRHLLSEDIPVIVEYGLQPENEYRWLEWMGHYLLVTAYDDEQEVVWVYDSWPRTGEIPDEDFVFEPLEIGYEELDRNWRAFNRNYIALYRQEQSDVVADIIGDDMDDAVMWQNARRVVQTELEEEPENPFLWFNLGTIFNAQRDYERAAAAFDQARSIGLPWRMLWYQFGPYEAYLQTGRYDDVIVLADVTLQDRPYFEESYYYKALAQAELGDVEAARQNLQRAIDFNPTFVPARTALEELELASN